MSGTGAHPPGRLDPEAVREMFDRITPVYDAMNRIMTMGLDQRWRKLAAESVVESVTACSTPAAAPATRAGGLAAGGRVTGLDFPGAHARAGLQKAARDRGAR
jgi:demethylmenaquinone methyltransferase/2-methoxy-6-polyprenyl-1,4-benzoquinol methylase